MNSFKPIFHRARLALSAGLFFVAFGLLSAASARAADAVVDSINRNATPSAGNFQVENFGWPYTPTFSYSLDAVQTKFSSAPASQTVTVEVWQGIPSQNGSSLLASGTFTAAANAFSGASLSSTVALTANTQYFIGFRNVTNLGFNTTTDNGATQIPVSYYTPGPNQASDNYSTVNNVDTAPILLFFEGAGSQPVVTTSVVHRGSAVPSAGILAGIPSDAEFATFGPPAIGADGTVAFKGNWVSLSTRGAGSKGTVIVAGNSTVAVAGQPAVGQAATVLYKSFSDPLVDDAGHLAFLATLEGHGLPAGGASLLVSNAPGGNLLPIAQSGQLPPGSAAGVKWSKFSSITLPGGGRGPVFQATLANSKIGNQAVFGTDSTGVVRRLFGIGDLNGAKKIRSFAVLKAVTPSPGYGRSYNNAGQITWMAIYTDGTEELFTTALP